MFLLLPFAGTQDESGAGQGYVVLRVCRVFRVIRVFKLVRTRTRNKPFVISRDSLFDSISTLETYHDIFQARRSENLLILVNAVGNTSTELFVLFIMVSRPIRQRTPLIKDIQ